MTEPKKKFSAEIRVSVAGTDSTRETIWACADGPSLDEFEENLRLVCHYAEACKFDPREFWRREANFESEYSFYSDLRAKFREFYGEDGVRILLTPGCEFYERVYDEKKHAFKDGSPVRDLIGVKCLGTPEGTIEDMFSETPVPPPAKPSKTEEGTTKLSSKMTSEELVDAVAKGGIKTVDLDDYEDFKGLVAKTRKGM